MKLTPSLRRILSALDKHGDMEPPEIAETACVGVNTLSGGGYLTKLLTMGLIRVSRWERADKCGPFRPVYSVSPGENAKKPSPYTNAQKSKRWKKRAGYYKPEYQRRKALAELARITAWRSSQECE